MKKNRNIPVNEAEEGTIGDVASELSYEEELAESPKKPQHEAIPKSSGKTGEELGKVDRLNDNSASGYTIKQGEGSKNIQEKNLHSRAKQETKEIAEEEPGEPATIVESETTTATGKAMAKKTRKTVRLKDITTVQDFEEQEETEAEDINDNKNNWRLFDRKEKKTAAAKATLEADYNFYNDVNIKNLYQNKRYQEIIGIYTEKENLNRDQYYYLGLSYYYMEVYEKAISVLDRSIQNNTDDTTLNSLYYKALSLSKTNNRDKAIIILQELQEIDHPISIKAKKMLIKLQND